MRPRMANLSALLQDLADRIASKDDGPHGCTQLDDDDPVVARFRSILPTLLQGYLAPSKVKERESMAILKLLCHTVTHYPAVFHHGKGHGVLPVLGRIVPLLSQHTISSTHALLFDTLCALISILRDGDKDIYRLFFSGALLLVQDLVSVATFFSSATHFTSSTSLSLQCYSAAYEMVYDANVAVQIPLCQLPSQWTPLQGHGLLIHVTGACQWLPLASWTLRLINHCLGEGALLVEGLLTFTFLEAVGVLLCYGDSDLHKASFELVRVAASIMDPELIPSDKLIMSLLSLLVESAGLLLPFRNNTYDSALASCLVALFSTSHADVIECTAQTFMEVFPSAISRTTSSELRVALSETFCVIIKHCPWYANHLGSLLQLAFNPELCPSLSHCIQLAVEVLGLDVVTGCASKAECITPNNRAAQGVGYLQQFCDHCGKWQVKDVDNKLLKRQKLSSGLHGCKKVNCKAMSVGPGDSHTRFSNAILPDNEEKMVNVYFHNLFLKTIAELEPHVTSHNVDNMLAALSTLARVCAHFPGAACSNSLVQQLQLWIPWLLDKEREGTLTVAQLSMFLEATEKLISGQGTSGGLDMQLVSASSSRDNLNFLNQCSLSESAILDVLVLPWSLLPTSKTESPSRMKCRALSIVVKLASHTDAAGVKIVLEHAFKDDDVAVRAAAVRTVPQLAAWSSPEIIRDFCTRFCDLRMDGAEQVRYTVAETIGLVVCAWYCRYVKQERSGEPSLHQSSCMCPIWEAGDYSSMQTSADVPSSPDMDKPFIVKGPACLFALDLWRSCFEQLLFQETSENVQVAFVESMSRILRHMSIAELELTRADWLKCLDVLPLHDHRAVREAFSVQIHCFTEDKVLEGIFGISDDSNTSNRDLQMLGKLKHALDVSNNPAVIETLLESVAEVAQAARHRRQLLFFSLVLLVEHVDSATVSVQVASVRLLHKIAAVGWPAAKSPPVQLMVSSVQEELFEYLCKRLITRPSMLTQVSEAVMSMETSEFLTLIIPVVLPKLILEQQQNPQALCILHELSRLRDTQLPLLLVEFCHQILSVLLLRADGNELLAALQFYEAQTGSETRDLFAAVLPALLDELVRFLGDDTGDALKRSARVALMIQEVASIVTGSDDLPSFLRTHFVGLLNSIDRKLLRANDLTSQKQALRCIERLLDMIGQHLSAFVPKIMALLTRALQERSLQSDGLAVWLFFVQTLARVAPTALKHIASQIVVALMACLEAHLEEETPNLSAVVCVLEELIIRNRTVLDDQIRELPLLPSHPKLAKVNDVLHEARGLLSLRDQLQQAADGLGHESLSVRYTTARELSKWMRTKRKDITCMILGEMSLDATVINNLTTALLRGCGEESRTVMSQRLKMACAECLGELGAIDPAKLHVDLRHRSSIERSDEDLVFELINEHLAKVLRAAGDTDVQDAAALAIQELLKYSGCREDLLGGRLTRPSGSKAKSKLNKSEVLEASKRTPSMSFDNVSSTEAGEQLWRRFSEDVKEIITPCLTSKYHLKDSGAAIPDGPIFGSGLSFRRWIYLWIRRLVSQATGARAHIFIACRGVVRHDMGTALYLLPYLVLNVICYGSTEARDSVTKEILAVLAKADSSNTDSVTPLDVPIGNVSRSWSGPGEMSTQSVFALLDNLGQWLDDSKIVISPATQVTKGAGAHAHMHDQPQVDLSLQHKHAAELLDAIPKQALAGASFRCQAYARALLYFESHIRASSGALNPAAGINGDFKDEDLTLLLEIYSGLDEPDGLTGLSRLRKSMSLQDQILINEKAGNWAEALTCCEQALQLEPTSVPRHCGVLNCLLNMGHLRALVTHVDGLVLRLPDNTKDWSSRGVQAAWRLGQWNLLDEYVEGADIDGPLSAPVDSNTAFDISLARILQALQKGDRVAFRERLAQCRQSLLAPLAAASMESYTRAYPLIVKLHMLKELEDFSALTCQDGNTREENRDGSNTDLTILNVIAHWEDRLHMTQQSLWTREPILALRRLVFKAIDMPAEVGTCWLQYAKLCRTAGHYETARCAILEAQSAGAANVHVEMAKLLWNTQKGHQAILELQQAIPPAYLEKISAAAGTSVSETGQVMKLPKPAEAKRSMTSMDASQLRRDEHRNAAKTLLLLARWGHHTGQKHKEEILKLFYNVRELQPRWEKGFFYVAKYYDDLLVDARRRQEEGQDTNVNLIGAANQRQKASSSVVADDKPWWTYLSDAILYYAKALHRGHRRLFQALPRLLTLWFEFGSVYRDDTWASVKGVKTVHVKLMNIMRGCLKELPSYQWLTALSQLVSRIGHPNDDVVKLVKVMITTVIRAHPQQALWTMAAVSKSTVQARREAAAEVLKLAASGESDKLLFTQFTLFIEHMIKLCFYGGHPKAKFLSIATDFGTLKRMMPVRVIMPIQQALTVALPADGLTNNTFNPFSALENSTIHSIKDEVEVLASLQRPKKVVLVSSDGIEHPFLCKPKDDLRKDARMMEFTTMINRLLSKDPKSRKRKLYIRTFAVIPLTEESGMIEWVLHTRGLRHILQDLYVAAGNFDRKSTNNSIKQIYDQHLGQKAGGEMLRTKILPMFPPIFHRWFLNTFPEPAAWFRARIAYAHTSAVWSMVGHILGLGDRHGENILFDSMTGDCVHVDFSCLFDKGLTLEKPELVPFRLTQNMVDGLGITGYEGTFTRTCETTLCILRAHRETLMSVLETFIHDPLVEWTKMHKSSGVEVQNPHAQRAIANIEARLQGVVVGVGAAPSLPLSVEGQAHRLISEAVSHENLEKMYIWWMAWF